MENVKCRCQKGRPAEYRQFIISGTRPAVASCRLVDMLSLSTVAICPRVTTAQAQKDSSECLVSLHITPNANL